MKSPIPDYLDAALEKVRPNEDGQPAQYIKTLANADTSKLAVALVMVDGNVYSAGDDQVEFSIQSISKAFVYAIAIEDAGLEHVLGKIGVEPSAPQLQTARRVVEFMAEMKRVERFHHGGRVALPTCGLARRSNLQQHQQCAQDDFSQ